MLSEAEVSALRRQERWSAAFSHLTYGFLSLVGRLYFRYSFKDLERFRADVWKELEAHDGPVIWAANHLTLIDSFLIVWAVFPRRKVHRWKFVPWSTPEYRNYYQLGGALAGPAIRALMYLCRCIPFLREGEDQASVQWREKAFEKCAWVLRNGGSVFVYPEAGRSRSGWFEERKPKDFLGRLALEVPQAKFLCVYLRGESQKYTTVFPQDGESFRARAALIPAVLDGETAPRAVTARLFHALAALQLEWFKESPLPRNCGGNDVVDLKSPRIREHFDFESNEADPEWLERHLTDKERLYLQSVPEDQRYACGWKFFAAKEAAHKALAQSGIHTPAGGFRMIEVDLFRRKAAHLPTGCEVSIAFTAEDEDKIHCVAVLRGGYIGDDDAAGDVLWGLAEVPPGQSPQEFAREKCLEFIAESSDDIPSPAVLSFTDEGGVPKILRRGKVCDWGVSLSHSGRYAAYSFMIS